MLLAMASVVGCQNTSQSSSNELEAVNEEYFGTYIKVKSGELYGDYFDDYEAVPLEDDYSETKVTLKSNGTYESEHVFYSEEYGDIYSVVTNKYEYKFKDNEIIRERETTMDNFKSFDKIYKHEDGRLRVNDDYISRIEAEDATIIKDEDDYVIYERTQYKIANSDSDREENHREYDFITLEGEMISVNYYKDDDRTAVSIYRKVE